MANTKKVFSVKGMHCNSCTMLIEDCVSELKGVSSVKADLSKNNVSVSYDNSNLSEEDIARAIESEGYRVE